MCIVAIAWQVLDEMPLCLISNRDEFYQRPSSPLKTWQNAPIIAGQDLHSGGTWMGITATGRWAVLTNFRDATDSKIYLTSRGHLVQSFLQSEQTPIRYAKELEQRQREYAGFNLLMGDRHQAVYMSNRGEAPYVLPKGVYVVSNGLISDDWQKTQHLRQRFTQEFLPLLQHTAYAHTAWADLAWDILEDERKVMPTRLPNTGIPLDMEILLSSTFIESPNYGTRCSNFLQMSHTHWSWLEKQQQGALKGQIIQQQGVLEF